MPYKLIIVVITDVITPKTNKRRFVEIRGLFCYNTKYDVDTVIEKAVVALKQYAEEKGYDTMFVENFVPVVGEMDTKDVSEFIPIFEFEVVDKKYDRVGGFPDEAYFPENWVELSNSEIRRIIHEQITPFYQKGKMGVWRGYSVVQRRFDEYE